MMKKALGILSRNALTCVNFRLFSTKLPLVEPEIDDDKVEMIDWR